MNISTTQQTQPIQNPNGGADNLDPLTVTVSTAVKLTGLGRTKIWEMLKVGKVESVRVGRRRLVVYSSLKRLLEPQPARKPAKSQIW